MAVATLTPAPALLPADTPHMLEVWAAQSAADAVGAGGCPSSASGPDPNADLELLRVLVTAYGADGVRRMLDSLN
jgi:hypothetical protein